MTEIRKEVSEISLEEILAFLGANLYGAKFNPMHYEMRRFRAEENRTPLSYEIVSDLTKLAIENSKAKAVITLETDEERNLTIYVELIREEPALVFVGYYMEPAPDGSIPYICANYRSVTFPRFVYDIFKGCSEKDVQYLAEKLRQEAKGFERCLDVKEAGK